MTTNRNIDITPIIIEGLQDKKARAISLIDLRNIETAPTSQFVVCEARNPIQVAAVADAVQDRLLLEAGRKPVTTDGYRNREWIIIDMGEAIIHIFLPETRQRYALEELYADAPITSIPDID